jgi:tripartite-type tricarboxylate transporter receptor subunit TctC
MNSSINSFFRVCMGLALGMGLSLFLGVAQAQNYPARAVRLVDPFPPGAITSNTARLIAARFQEQTGQAMVVDNKPGAGTNLGGDIVAKASPDGYTLLLGTSSLAINPWLYKSMPFDPVRDLQPILLLVRTPNVLAVSAALPVRSVQELIDHARAHPGRLNYASSGNGASNHLGMELFRSMTGTQMQHVPFKGGAEAVTALLAGHVQVMFSPESTVGPHHRSGRLRIIAVAGEQRLSSLAGIPTVAESGVPGFESGVWLGLFAPAGTPEPVVQRINAEANRALQEGSVQQALRQAGLTPVGGSVAHLRSVLLADTERMRTVVKASGATVD